MSGEARLTAKVKELEDKLMELCALANNAILEGSFKGEGILQAAALLNICQNTYKEYAPPEADPRAEEDAEVIEDSAKEEDVAKVEESKASNE